MPFPPRDAARSRWPRQPVSASAGSSAQTAPTAGPPTTIDAERDRGRGRSRSHGARQRRDHARRASRIFGDDLRYNREFGRAEGDGGVRLQTRRRPLLRPAPAATTRSTTPASFEQPEFLVQRRARRRAASAERSSSWARTSTACCNAQLHHLRARPGRLVRCEARELELDYERDEGQRRAPRLRFFDMHDPRVRRRRSFPLENQRRKRLSRAVLLADQRSAASSSACRTTGTSRPSTTRRSRRST